ncbi:MAG: pantoate--beta-alanine ligase [Desulfobacter sp.]|nr:pantoate--beta-alanine ligase [Desulfobacter sp.]WDP84728.1 MAG: pantoate--beta-alanine ligase [Desulfobacter sp.]
MDILKTKSRMQAWSGIQKKKGKTISFVPTMGYLHKGHLSLLEIGGPLCDELVLSIFVNPTQFGPNEDLDAYPRSIEKDLAMAEAAGVTAVFLPNTQEMYTQNYQTRVSLDHLPNFLCGKSRPVHFGGVATVVTKLFNIVQPDVAIFGKKDYQQLQVIKQMTRDLDFNIKIIGGEIIREADGLAMSSRNAYLTPDQRQSALCLSRAIELAKKIVAQGDVSILPIVKEMETFIHSFDHTRVDYIEFCDPETLEPVDLIESQTLVAMAVQVGKSRLLDNGLIDLPQ